MSQHYSDPNRSEDPSSLPDVETFYHRHAKQEGECIVDEESGDCRGSGWYYWYCLPGCLPDSEPIGPFESEAAAVADAQEGYDE